mmetsp:Transcript_97993/g.143462  ORF Transcript_97993/g.143462 Transcript_97993/m.143462 type:complete len:81 (+) Transcript_97993:176-418(+)
MTPCISHHSQPPNESYQTADDHPPGITNQHHVSRLSESRPHGWVMTVYYILNTSWVMSMFTALQHTATRVDCTAAHYNVC